MAVLAIGIKQNDEVIVPNYTQIAKPNSVKLLGATPVFVNVEKDALCLDYDFLKEVINSKIKVFYYY